MAKPYIIAGNRITNPNAIQYLSECENILDEDLEPDTLLTYFDYGVSLVESFHAAPGEMERLILQAVNELFVRSADVDEDSIDTSAWEDCYSAVEIDGMELSEWSVRYVTIAEMLTYGLDDELELRGHFSEEDVVIFLEYLYGSVDEDEMASLAEQAVEAQ